MGLTLEEKFADFDRFSVVGNMLYVTHEELVLMPDGYHIAPILSQNPRAGKITDIYSEKELEDLFPEKFETLADIIHNFVTEEVIDPAVDYVVDNVITPIKNVAGKIHETLDDHILKPTTNIVSKYGLAPVRLALRNKYAMSLVVAGGTAIAVACSIGADPSPTPRSSELPSPTPAGQVVDSDIIIEPIIFSMH